MEATIEMTSETEMISNLSEKLESYRRLAGLRDGLQTRIDKAVAEQETVSEHIFRKVISEYRRELETVDSEIAPLDAELDEAVKELEQQREQQEQALADLEDEVSEAEFRARVGELNDGAIEDACSRILPRIDDQKRRVSQLEQQIETLTHRSAPPTQKIVEESDSPDQQPAAEDFASVVPEPTPAPAAEPVPEPAPSMDSFDGDFVQVPTTDTAPGPEATAVATDPQSVYDPLAALADPTPAPESESDSLGFLDLVISSGGHAGKRIPLLPMTMSIGREHDNNIELKDPDVARYHARITYCDGHFALENLVGSTGTWINGEAMQEAVLKVGDLIKLGETEIRVE